MISHEWVQIGEEYENPVLMEIPQESNEWVEIGPEYDDSYPDEGETVLISDGDDNYDTAYYILSGEYKWLKENISLDTVNDFDDFSPTKWKEII